MGLAQLLATSSNALIILARLILALFNSESVMLFVLESAFASVTPVIADVQHAFISGPAKFTIS